MAVRIDASGKYLYRTANLPGTANFTLTAWVYLVADRNQTVGLIGLIDGSGNGCQILTATDGTTLRLYVNHGGGVVSDVSGSDLGTGAWRHVAVVKSGSSYTVYLDGESNITLTDSFSWTPAYLVMSDSGLWPNARYGQTRVWNAGLSQAEVQAEMRSATPVRTADLNANYAFVSSTTSDSSGNGYNLTAVGSPALETPEPPTLVLGGVAGAVAGAAAGTVSAGSGVVDATITGVPAPARAGSAASAVSADGNVTIAGLPAAARVGASAGAASGAASVIGLPAAAKVGAGVGVVSAGASLAGLPAGAQTGAVGAVVSTGISVNVSALPAGARAGSAGAALTANATIAALPAAVMAGAAVSVVSTGLSVTVVGLPAAAMTGAGLSAMSTGASLSALPAAVMTGAAAGNVSTGLSATLEGLPAAAMAGAAAGDVQASVVMVALVAMARVGAAGGQVHAFTSSTTPAERVHQADRTSSRTYQAAPDARIHKAGE